MTITGPTHFPTTTVQPASAPQVVPSENPSEEGIGAPRGGAKMYGSFSLERFCDVGGLTYTHEDANGFVDYVAQFNTPNFRYRDDGVKVWAYYETYDNWQDTYGMDAVRAVYHSGHGGMDANGVFYVPMGAAWAGNDCTANSTEMRLGNETARYVFWSTCESLRVFGGHTPIRTWSAANLGLRMIFGFETVSWDDPNYGANFWKHWKNNESFSSAWLNGSWDIAHDQAPTVTARGATVQEAQDRVNNERYFSGATASTAWWWWRWYNVAASLARSPGRTAPADRSVALLAPVDSMSLRAIADRFEMSSAGAISRAGVTSLSEGGRDLSIGAGGLVTAHLATVNTGNREPLGRRAAIDLAGVALRRYGLEAAGPLVLDRVVEQQDAGGTADGATLQGPFTTATVVQYRQVVNGTPIITPDAGIVRITLDNDGTLCTVNSDTRDVVSMTDRPRINPGEPSPNVAPAPASRAAEDPDVALDQAFGASLARRAALGSAPVGYHTVAGSTEVGYDVQGDEAVLVARRAVELEFAGGYRKRYWVQAPLAG